MDNQEVTKREKWDDHFPLPPEHDFTEYESPDGSFMPICTDKCQHYRKKSYSNSQIINGFCAKKNKACESGSSVCEYALKYYKDSFEYYKEKARLFEGQLDTLEVSELERKNQELRKEISEGKIWLAEKNDELKIKIHELKEEIRELEAENRGYAETICLQRKNLDELEVKKPQTDNVVRMIHVYQTTDKIEITLPGMYAPYVLNSGQAMNINDVRDAIIDAYQKGAGIW